MSREYKEKHVAFLDILGFSSMMRHEGENAQHISDLFDVIVRCKDKVYEEMRCTRIEHPAKNLNELSDAEMEDGGFLQCYDAALNDMVIKIVSDSIIIAIPREDEFAFTVIVDVCAYIARRLLDFGEGYLIRGAITCGKVYLEEESVFFGDAYIRACKLEASSCIYPRVIFGDDGGYLNTVGYTLIHTSEDGWGEVDYIGNYLGIRAEVWDDERAERLKRLITREISSNKDKPEVVAKYLWIKTQMQRTYEFIREMELMHFGKFDSNFDFNF